MKKSKDEFVDLREALQSIVRNQGVWRDLLEQISTSIEGTKQAKTIGEFINVVPKENSDWQKFQFGVFMTSTVFNMNHIASLYHTVSL